MCIPVALLGGGEGEEMLARKEDSLVLMIFVDLMGINPKAARDGEMECKCHIHDEFYLVMDSMDSPLE